MDERRHGADVLAEGADGDQVAGDAIELACDHPTEFPPACNFCSSELFRRHAENLVGEHGGKIVGPIRVWHVSMPGNFLADLLDGAMQVTDIGNRLVDHFAVGLDHEAQHAVRTGVLRSDADSHVFGVETLVLDRRSLVHILFFSSGVVFLPMPRAGY